MNPISISSLATLFTTAGVLIGIPSITVLVSYVFYRVMSSGKSAASTDFGSNPDALLLILKGISTVLGFVADLVGSVAQFIFNALAIAAIAGLVFAVLCWLTGRGLSAQATWARVSAGVLLTLVLLLSLLLALSLHDVARLIMLALVGLCLFALHTVWTGYVSQAPISIAN